MPEEPDMVQHRPDPRRDAGERELVAGPARSGLVEAIHRLERRAGTYRPGRSPWVWVLGPGVNLLATTLGVLWVGLANDLGWITTVPLAIFCGIAMSAMAALFLGTSWEQEEDERRAAEALAGALGDLPPTSASRHRRTDGAVSGGDRRTAA
jgi:hypothetical protein